MKHWRPISEEQRAYIVAHMNDRPRVAVAKAAGVSPETFYRVVREHGGELRHDLSRRNPEWEEIVRAHYADMEGHEIERKFGMAYNRANKIAQRLGLRHSPETEERIRREARLRLSTCTRDYEEMGEKRRRLFRMERLRVESGMRQRTGLKIAVMTSRGRRAKSYMVCRYNYFGIGRRESHILCYDGETRRNPALEERYARYGLEFVPADGYDGGKEAAV